MFVPRSVTWHVVHVALAELCLALFSGEETLSHLAFRSGACDGYG